MTKHKTRWLLVGLVCLALWPAHASAQGGLWETYMAAGVKAYQQAMATDLNNLALLYQAQGRYAEAEPLYKRSLAILEKALGAEHPDVAQSLENYAVLLRKTGRDIEAAKLEARAKAIRAKHAEQNPVQ